MKLTAYLRVSTDRQAEHGNGLDVQRAAIRSWAKANGHRVIQWRTDDGVSGSNGLETREDLALAFGDLQDGTSAGLVVAKLDRLARDLIVQETLIAEVRKIGAELFTTAAGEADFLADDPNDPSRKLIRQVLGAVNEYERSMIVLRMKSGRKVKAAKGGYAGYGSPRFGQRSVDKELVADEREQAVKARLRDLRDAGMSYRDIAAQANAEGLKSKRGGEWHSMTVSRVLQRDQA
jgi:DNA invertase Pin-like site-specific DNA recombinase